MEGEEKEAPRAGSCRPEGRVASPGPHSKVHISIIEGLPLHDNDSSHVTLQPRPGEDVGDTEEPRARTWSSRRGQLRPFRRLNSLSWGRTWGWTRATFPEDQVLPADSWTFADGAVGGMYLSKSEPGGQDLLWSLLNQEEEQRLIDLTFDVIYFRRK